MIHRELLSFLLSLLRRATANRGVPVEIALTQSPRIFASPPAGGLITHTLHVQRMAAKS